MKESAEIEASTGADPGTWERLRRRKVVQWGIAYAAGAWVLLQVIGFAADAFSWPIVAKQLAMLALAIGLPVVVVLAWYHGDRGQQRVTATELAILALLFLIGGGLFWRYERASESPPTVPDVRQAARFRAPGPAHDKSVAVLPFTNLAHDDDSVEFADGLHDDLLTQLAKIGQLKVISRTSMLEYRGTTKRIPQIARELGVASILEGGVQRSGQRIRLNVQLIDAATDEHLWAETYDRELTAENIFAIQSELASSIAGALKASLSPEEKASVGRVLTTNLAALEAYRRSLTLLQRTRPGEMDQADQDADEALRLDPKFAAAWALKARVAEERYWEQGLNPRDRDAARAAIEKGRAISPDLPELDWAEAYYHYYGFRDYAKALAIVERGERAQPGNVDLAMLHGFILRRMGRVAESLSRFGRAQKLDPRNVGALAEIPDTYQMLGRYAEADAEIERLLNIDPSFQPLRKTRAWVLINQKGDLQGAAAQGSDDPYVRWWLPNALGNYDEALKFVDFGSEALDSVGLHPPELMRGLTLRYAGRHGEAALAFDRSIVDLEATLAQRPNDTLVQRALCLAHGGRGQRQAALAMCRKALETAPLDALLANDLVQEVSEGLALAGAADQAIATLESGLGNVLSQGAGFYENDPAFHELRSDPRFKALMRRYRERAPR
jgi:TolB-like protein/Flp pilus assembly protein TadD